MQKGRRNPEILIPAPRCLAVFFLKVLWLSGQLGACPLFLPMDALQRSCSQTVHRSSAAREARARVRAPGRRQVAGLPSVLLCGSSWGINSLSSLASVSSFVKLRGSRARDSLILYLSSWALDSVSLVNYLEHLAVHTLLCHPQRVSPLELFAVSLFKVPFLPP